MENTDSHKMMISNLIKEQRVFLGATVLKVARSVQGLEVSDELVVTKLLRSADAVIAELNEKLFYLTGWSRARQALCMIH